MNFEELVATRDARKNYKVRLPFGYFHKRLIDGKYSNFVEFHDEVADHISFNNSVRTECEAIATIASKHQLHFTPNEGDDGVYALAVEVGNFLTIEQLINENPAIIAQQNFIKDTINDLVELTHELNERQIYHLCFAPSNVLVRKNDASVKLLCHGSFYLQLDQEQLYEGVEEYVAPEVLNENRGDERSDVYSLAKFICWLYDSSGLPIALKQVMKKATAENPKDRYANVEELRKAIEGRTQAFHSGVVGGVAIAIALAVVGLYFYLLPSPEVIEYVAPKEDIVPEELVEEGLDPLVGIGADADSATIARIVKEQMGKIDSMRVDDKKLKEYQAKAEQIFRRRYEKEADAILSKIYNTEKMNSNEKEFMSKSKAVVEELAKKQQELGSATSLSDERSQVIASEIIDQLTEKKKAAMEKAKKEQEKE